MNFFLTVKPNKPLYFFLTLMLFSSCGPKERFVIQQPADAGSMPSSEVPRGDIDSSGGSAGKSKHDEILEILSKIKVNLKLSIHRVFSYRNDSFTHLYIDGNEAIDKLLATSQRQGKSLYQHIEGLQIKPQNEPCEAIDEFHKTVEHKEAAANEKGEVCFSIDLLTRIPKEALEIRILALGIHEVAHTLKFKEATAQDVQDWYLNNSDMVLPQFDHYRKLLVKIITLRHGILPDNFGYLRFFILNLDFNKADGFYREICLKAGEIKQQLYDLRSTVGSIESYKEYKFPKFILTDLEKLYDKEDSVRSACTGPVDSNNLIGRMDGVDRLIVTIKSIHQVLLNFTDNISKFISPTKITGSFYSGWETQEWMPAFELQTLISLDMDQKLNNALKEQVKNEDIEIDNFDVFVNDRYVNRFGDWPTESELKDQKAKPKAKQLKLVTMEPENIRCDIGVLNQGNVKVFPLNFQKMETQNQLTEDPYSALNLDFKIRFRAVTDVGVFEGKKRKVVVDIMDLGSEVYHKTLVRIMSPNKDKLSKVSTRFDNTQNLTFDMPLIAQSLIDYKSWEIYIPFMEYKEGYGFNLSRFFKLAKYEAVSPRDRLNESFMILCMPSDQGLGNKELIERVTSEFKRSGF
ncbi:MAG: hypothetical protein KDD50_05535 [Bdellovibrionales bacterium]|nr:hypothetical protein [Bdellovibrionales bacterium]